MDDKNDPAQQPIGTSPRMRDQPSLTTSSGRSWLILGGLLALIAVVVLIPLLSHKPAGVALFGLSVIVALYAAMVVVRFNLRPGRLLLGSLAALMIAIAAVGVICVGIIAAVSGNVALY